MDDTSVPPSPLSALSSLPPTPSMDFLGLPESDDESNSEGRTLSLGTEDHLSVRPTTSIADGISAKLASTQKKRKRQVLDYILMPPLLKVVRSASTSVVSQDSSTSQAKEKDKERRRETETETETDDRLQVDMETVYLDPHVLAQFYS